MNTSSSQNWFSIFYLEAGRHAAAYGTSSLSEAELIAALESGKYIRLDNLIYWDCGRAKSMKEWSKTDCDRIYINPSMVVSITPMHDDPRTIIKTIDDLPPPKTLKGHIRRWLQRKVEQLEKEQTK